MQIRKFLIVPCSVLLLVLFITMSSSCNSKKEKRHEVVIKDMEQKPDTPPPPPPPPPPIETPPAPPLKWVEIEGEKSVQKCFKSEGLKYQTTINILVGEKHLFGTVSSIEIGADKGTSTDFEGTIEGKKLIVKFDKTPPVVGDASEWTKKPWIIEGAGKQEKLLITFNAKNYETNKWEDMKYEFLPCK